jgi:hypothetical protein
MAPMAAREASVRADIPEAARDEEICHPGEFYRLQEKTPP